MHSRRIIFVSVRFAPTATTFPEQLTECDFRVAFLCAACLKKRNLQCSGIKKPSIETSVASERAERAGSSSRETVVLHGRTGVNFESHKSLSRWYQRGKHSHISSSKFIYVFISGVRSARSLSGPMRRGRITSDPLFYSSSWTCLQGKFSGKSMSELQVHRRTYRWSSASTRFPL